MKRPGAQHPGVDSAETGDYRGGFQVAPVSCVWLPRLVEIDSTWNPKSWSFKLFERELENNRIVVDGLLSVEGTKILSEMPRKHTLTRADTIGSFDKIAESHKKRGYYFSNALEEKGVTGVIPGATKIWKFNTYGMTKNQAVYLAEVFADIARENSLPMRA